MTESITNYKLVVRKGEEHLVPQCGLIQDSRYFNYESLIRIYGQAAVDKFYHSISGFGVTK